MNGHYENARQAIQAEAAEWVLQLEDNELDRKRREELYAWLTSSPTHIDEFLLASAVWRELDGIDADKQVEIDQLLANASDNVVTLGKSAPAAMESPQRRRWVVVTWLSGLAAAVTIFAFVLSTATQPGAPVRFETATGQQTLFTLADGSIVHLNTRSALDVEINESQRTLTLLRGEAMFEVAKDPERPFRVAAGDVVVEAIGTAFNVYRHDGQVQVTVVEGEVTVEQATASLDVSTPAVERVQLLAGQEALSNASGEIAQIEAPDLEKRTAWREQRLVFREDSLADVAAQFNRYNSLQLVIEASATQRITATFDAHDPQSFIAFLERDPALRVVREGDTVRVLIVD